MTIPFVDLAAQYAAIAEEVDEAIAGVLRNTDFILGNAVEAFEKEFAEYCEVDYAVGVDSGTSALELALRALGVGPGDEVITAANTFIATALAISYTGARPVFVDIESDTFNMDPVRLPHVITPRTKAIIPVHLCGQPAEMDRIMDVAREHGLKVIEDACQAHGARYQGQRVGSIGDAAAFSFYPSKNLGAYGDGGMVVTRHKQIYERIRLLRNYGQQPKNHHIELGFNRRLDTVQAAVLRVKLRCLDDWNNSRRAHARQYGRLLEGSGVKLPRVAENREHVYHLYAIQAVDRDKLQASLKEKGISSGTHYPMPIHLQPAYAKLGYAEGSFPVSEWFAEHALSLPIYAEMSEKAIREVAQAVHEGNHQETAGAHWLFSRDPVPARTDVTGSRS